MNEFLNGALCMASLVAGLVFLRAWRTSRDRLFLWFCAAFCVLAAQWVLLAAFHPAQEHAHYVFVPRLVAYLLIVAGIVDKNARV